MDSVVEPLEKRWLLTANVLFYPLTSGSIQESPGGSMGISIQETTSSANPSVAVPYVVTGTATSGVDYQPLSGSITFPATSGPTYNAFTTIPLTLIDDGRWTANPTLIITLQPGSGYTLGASQATITITEPENRPVPPTVPPPSNDCPTSPVNISGDPTETASPSDPTGGGDPGNNTDSTAPVRYSDGTLHLTATDLSSAGFGTPWAQGRSWTNNPAYVGAQQNGNNWVDSAWPRLIEPSGAAGAVAAITGGDKALWFDNTNGSGTAPTYAARLFLQNTLVYQAADDGSGTNEFVLTNPDGSQTRFYDFSTSLPVNERGAFKSYRDPAGNQTSVYSHDATGNITEIRRHNAANTAFESWLYTYSTSGANSGTIQNVQLRRSADGSTWTVARQVSYTYYQGTYAGNDAYGNLNDLQTAVIEDGSGTPIDASYYRYYVGNDANTHGNAWDLKYAFDGASYARLAAALPSGTTPLTATDAQVAPYAAMYLEYDSSNRVTKEIVQGAGCSCSGSASGTFTYAYTASANTPGVNSWAEKTVVGLPDGSTDTVYTNTYGEVMLKAHHDVGTGVNNDNFYKYDSSGRIVLHADPSAVTGYDDTKADLLNNVGGNYQYLSDTTGLINITDYGSSTTATASSAGDVAGYFKDSKVEHGELGTAIAQESATYLTRAGAGSTVYPVAADTVYGNTEGTNARTTYYTYTWVTGTARVATQATAAPVISSSQNGPGVADTVSDTFDTYGRLTQQVDADGYTNTWTYDDSTGAMTQSVMDTGTGGLNLTTSYTVDALGRDTQVTDPAGNITYVVYNDPDHEIRTYPNWNSSTNTPTGPTIVQREYRPAANAPTGQQTVYHECLTTSDAPHLTSGKPDGTETVTAGNIQTLSHDLTNNNDQTVESDAYASMSGVTYSQPAAKLGTAGANYYATLKSYDGLGNVSRVLAPTGTITRTVYDSLSRVISTWIGTNDTPTSGYWSPTNNNGTSNMVDIADYQYDSGGSGDSDLTQVTQHPTPGTASADRVTQNLYDFQDRQVASKEGMLLSGGSPNPSGETDGVHRPIIYRVLDNLGETVRVYQYDGDTVPLTDFSTSAATDQIPTADAANVRAAALSSYDDQGRVYASSQLDVSPTSGFSGLTDAQILALPKLTTSAFHDHRGNVVMTANPGGMVEKMQYDGAGRLVKDSRTDGAVLNSPSTAGTWSEATNYTDSNDVVLAQTRTSYDSDGNPILVESLSRFDVDPATGSGATGDLGSPAATPYSRNDYTAQYFDAGDRLTDSVDVGTNGGSAYARPASVPSPSDTVLVTHTDYNPAGWVLDSVDPRGQVTKNLYDLMGRVTSTIAGYNASINSGNPTNTNNQTTTYTYDGDRNVLSMTAVMPAGTNSQTTAYVYGAGSSSNVFSNDLLATVEYPSKSTGAASTAASDDVSYTYNALGQRTGMTDQNGSVHAYSYDPLGRETADVVSTLGSGVDGTIRRLGYAFNGQGLPYQQASYSDSAGTTIANQVQDVYNGFGQLTGEYQSHSGPVVTASTPQVQYAYTEAASGDNSRLTSMTYPNGRVLNDNYNAGIDGAISRVSSLADAGGSGAGTIESYAYLGLNTIVQRTQGNGVDLSYIQQTGDTHFITDAGDRYSGLDRFGRVIDQSWSPASSPTTPTDRFQYAYDRDGNVVSKNNLVSSVNSELYHPNSTAAGDNATAYDPLNRLTSFQRGTLGASGHNGSGGLGSLDTIASASRTQGWMLDALGNWSSSSTNGTNTSRTNNSRNQVTAVGGSALTFDNTGNTTTDEKGQTYSFDAWNRTTTAKAAGPTLLTTYGWDADGRRITETPASTGTTTDVYFSTAGQALEERQGTTVTRQYVWNAVGYVNDLVLRDDNAVAGSYGSPGSGLGQRLYVQQDANHNVTSITDASGNVVQRFIYDPYGARTVLTGNWQLTTDAYSWTYGFQGGRVDPLTGLYHFGARDYSPTLGRWLQMDPAGYVDSNSLYMFANGRPLIRTDPSGRSTGLPSAVAEAAASGMTAQQIVLMFGAGVVTLEAAQHAIDLANYSKEIALDVERAFQGMKTALQAESSTGKCPDPCDVWKELINDTIERLAVLDQVLEISKEHVNMVPNNIIYQNTLKKVRLDIKQNQDALREMRSKSKMDGC